MRVEIPDVKRLHQRLMGKSEKGVLERKKDFVGLSGRHFYMDQPLVFGELDFEREKDMYSVCLELVAFDEGAFKGLSKVFAADFFNGVETNDGEIFREINSDGVGYILDKKRRATFAFSPGIFHGEEDKKYPSRQILMGDSGAITRLFNSESYDLFVKEVAMYQKIANIYIHSIYSLRKSKDGKFNYDPNSRIIISPSLSEGSSDDYFDDFY